MSDKRTVIQTIAAELEHATGVESVALDQEHWTQTAGSDMPALFLEDVSVSRERISFQATTTLDDMEAIIRLTVHGRVFDIQADTAIKLDELIDRVETTLVLSTAIAGVVKDIYPVEDSSDEGALETYGHARQSFEVVYHYNHSNP